MENKPKEVPILEEEIETDSFTGADEDLSNMGLYSPDNENCPWIHPQ